MSDELQISLSIQSKLGGILRDVLNVTAAYDQANEGIYGGPVQNIGTSPVAIGFGAVTSARILVAYNLDLTNYVDLYVDDSAGAAEMKLLPRSATVPSFPAILPLTPGVGFEAVADTAACDVYVAVIDL